MAPPSRPHVFLLHHADDKAIAGDLSRRLSKHDVSAGSTIIGTGAQVLARSRACVLLVGPSAWQKGWAQRELAQLVKRRHTKEPFSFVVVYLPGAAELELAGALSIPEADEVFTVEGKLDDALVARLVSALGGEPVRPAAKAAASKRKRAAPRTPDAPADTVDTLTDQPADVDELGRKCFAEVLVQRIQYMRDEDTRRAAQASDVNRRCGGPFLLHLYAPWGAGKTSVLNFMRKELEKDDAWTVIDFNAWAHQRTAPPWWWLMTEVYRQGSDQLKQRDRKRWRKFVAWDLLWRVQGGALRGFLFLLAGLAFATLAWRSGGFGVQSLEGVAKAATAVIALGTTVYGGFAGLSRWLLVGSPRAAGTVLEHTRDPLETLKRRFRRLVRFFDNRVAIFIDDLDRCKAPYVVELLEGIQTLFNDVPVTYVVAADREWLCESYSLEYGGFVQATGEPGRPLGYLFLEKTFQLSAPVPTLSLDLQKDFLAGLLRVQGTLDRQELEQARDEATKKYQELPDEQAIAGALNKTRDASPIQLQAEREAAVLRLASPEVEERTSHTLQAFAPLLERNPRAIKRLINAYGVARATEILSGAAEGSSATDRERLVLWTILGLRWPLLAEYLADEPGAADGILAGREPGEEVPVNLRPLWRDGDVKAVLEGAVDEVSVRLDAATVELCAGRSRGVAPRTNGKAPARPRTRRTPARAAK